MNPSTRGPRLGDGRFYIGHWLIDPNEKVMASIYRQVVWLSDKQRQLLLTLAERPQNQVPALYLLKNIFANDENPGREYLQTVGTLKKHFEVTPDGETGPVLHMFDNGDLVLVPMPELAESHPLRRYIDQHRKQEEARKKEGKGGAISGCIQLAFWLLFVLGPLFFEAC